MFTGEFYPFYSEKPISNVFFLLKERMSCIGYTSWQDHGPNDGEEVVFFYKNEEMLEYHDENGYNLDIDGQGCFCIEARNADLYCTASLHEFDDKSGPDPYPANLAFENVFHYLLVLPDFIEKSEFCKAIFDSFVKTIKDA